MAKPHHSGTYHVQSKRVRDAAYRDPGTRCWRCRLTLDQCKPHRNGKPARWTAGHLIDGQVNGVLLPECSTCAATSGARYGNRLRGARRAARKAVSGQPTPPQRPTSFRW